MFIFTEFYHICNVLILIVFSVIKILGKFITKKLISKYNTISKNVKMEDFSKKQKQNVIDDHYYIKLKSLS